MTRCAGQTDVYDLKDWKDVSTDELAITEKCLAAIPLKRLRIGPESLAKNDAKTKKQNENKAQPPPPHPPPPPK